MNYDLSGLPVCKHDNGFRFLNCEAADRQPGVWACEHGCGYSLNFSPDHYPYGLAYRGTPLGNKELPEFKVSKHG